MLQTADDNALANTQGGANDQAGPGRQLVCGAAVGASKENDAVLAGAAAGRLFTSLKRARPQLGSQSLSKYD